MAPRKGCGSRGDRIHHGFGIGTTQEGFVPHLGGIQSSGREDETVKGDYDLASARGMDSEMGLGWLDD